MLIFDAKKDEIDNHIDSLEYQSWLTGFYVRQAIVSAFPGKKKVDYPQNPLIEKSKSAERVAKNTNKTEQELLQEKADVEFLVRNANFNISKKIEKITNQGE